MNSTMKLRRVNYRDWWHLFELYKTTLKNLSTGFFKEDISRTVLYFKH